MKEIQLLYAKNIVSRDRKRLEQELDFLILVSNFTYDKQVHVVWAGAEGTWQELQAEYYAPAGQNREIWRAHATFKRRPRIPLPGNIRFALRYRVQGAEYWDNNHSRDYSIEADSGVIGREDSPLFHIAFNPTLLRGQKSYPVSVAVHQSVSPRRVRVHWTTDNWKSQHRSSCAYQNHYWHQAALSNADNPNPYGWEVLTCEIEIEHAYRLEYAISCDTNEGRIWDNNFGANYLAQRERLKILTLNLHCCQEERQDEKFSLIARAISDLNIDIVCFQEVGEEWNQGKGDWRTNAAKIIKDRLKKNHYLHYHLYTDWAHIGFGRYREGVAVLSKWKFQSRSSGYLSASRDIHSIHTRKGVMVQVHVPYMGLVTIYSVHLSWWDGGFREQFENLEKWAGTSERKEVAATFLCGDFNAEAGSRGYFLVTGSKEYEDQFLQATAPDLFHRVFRKPSQGDLENVLQYDHRIDFIFKRKGSTLKVTSARALFTDRDYGRVSDHFGYYMEFEPRKGEDGAG